MLFRSSALTSLIRLATSSGLSVALFFVAVSDVEPFISHADGLVDALEDSNSEKQSFQVLVGLARATTYLYYWRRVPDGSAYDIRSRLIQLLHAYRCVLSSFSIEVCRGDVTQVWPTGYSRRSL